MNVAIEMHFHVIHLCNETETDFSMKLKPVAINGSRSLTCGLMQVY